MTLTAVMLIHLLVAGQSVDQNKAVQRNTFLETELIGMSMSD